MEKLLADAGEACFFRGDITKYRPGAYFSQAGFGVGLFLLPFVRLVYVCCVVCSGRGGLSQSCRDLAPFQRPAGIVWEGGRTGFSFPLCAIPMNNAPGLFSFFP